MNPFYTRVAILITELTVFLLMTGLATYFIALVSQPEFAAGAEPPADFPVIAYAGNRERPEPRSYVVVPWSEWNALAASKPVASLLLPERTASLLIGENQASFAVAEIAPSRQEVHLTWRSGGAEQRVRYTTDGRKAEPREFRTITSKTIILGGMVGFAFGMLIGQVLRRRFPLRPV